MRHAGLSPGTRRRRLSACSSWYRYLQRADAVLRNPFDGMDLPKRASKPSRHLTEAQLDDMVIHAVAHESARTAAIVAVLKATACRIGELTGVQLDALGYAGDHRILTLTAKGGRPHRVVIDDDVTGPLLDAYLAERGPAPGPLFATRTGSRLHRSYVQELLQRLASAAGIPDPHTLTPHAIRHSVATALLRAGEPLDVVQALLGHADPRTTQAYLHVDQLDRSPAHRAGPAAGRRRGTPPSPSYRTREPRPADIARPRDRGEASVRSWRRKRYPPGIRVGSGVSPVSTIRSGDSGSTDSRACVYGCRGVVSTCSTGPDSTIRPR
ncbi:hypothetical protein GCM10020219_101280 [Nonomuraea dietziae]